MVTVLLPVLLIVRVPVPLKAAVPMVRVPEPELLRFMVVRPVMVPVTLMGDAAEAELLKVAVAKPLMGAEMAMPAVLVEVLVALKVPAPVPAMAAVPRVIAPVPGPERLMLTLPMLEAPRRA